MTIKQQGGIFGRNPTFNDVSVENSLTVTGDLNVDSNTFFVESSTNRVGINNNNPTQELEVDGTIRVNLGVNDYAVGVVSSGGGGFFLEPDDYTASNPTWKFRTFANENIGMYRGNSDCGTFTANGLAFPSGKGIDFSATSGTGTSELFDDYEEGVWSPVISDATSGGNTGTATVAYATYTKVGNLVHLKARLLNMNTAGMGSGNIYVQGVPYSADGDGEGVATTSYFTASANSLGITPSIDNNASHIKLKEVISGGVYTNADSSQFTSGTGDLWITITYHT
jgi:hypothetical protein